METMSESPFRDRINMSVKEIGLGEYKMDEAIPFLSSTELGQLYRSRVADYLDRHRREGSKIPASPDWPAKPHISRIAIETNVPYRILTRLTPARKLLLQGVRELGLEIQIFPITFGAITYKQLLEAGSEWRSEELTGKPSASQQLSNTKTWLRFLREDQGRELDDIVGSELLGDFEKTVRRITAAMPSRNSRRKFRREIERWFDYHQRLLKAHGLPTEFGPALGLIIERSGLSIARLAELVGGNARNIVDWVHGMKMPSPNSIPLIDRIESTLGLPAKLLSGKVAFSVIKRIKKEDYPDFIRESESLRNAVRPHLPDNYDELPMTRREEIARWIIDNLVGPTTDWAHLSKQLSQAPYALKQFCPVLDIEWEALSAYKTSALHPPGTRRRGVWASATAAKHRSSFARIFGALALPKDAEDPRLRGLGIDPQSFTLALFLHPSLIHWWINWKGESRGEGFTSFEAGVIYSIVALLKPDTGWLRQRRDLAENLKPIPGYVDTVFIERAKSDWDGLCDEAVSDYLDLAKDIETVAVEARDPFEPIMSILESNSPISAIKVFAENILKDIPDPSISPIVAARRTRDYLLSKF